MLSKALDSISTGSNKLNESVKERTNTENLVRIQKTFTGAMPVGYLMYCDSPLKELRTPGRYFVREGSLIKLCRKIPKSRFFVLFNDALMYGSK